MPKTKEWDFVKDEGNLASIRAGRPSDELSREEASNILDQLIREATDAQFEESARRTARNERSQGGNYDAEYRLHLNYLKQERERLRESSKK